MCGIFGTTLELPEETLNRTLAALAHRGPDSNGDIRVQVASGRALTLQHTRLAIQDLSPNGHQPMVSQCGRWYITFNGEIYNHYDLRRELTVNFRGSSDTETLVEFISAFGVEATIEKLNGIFAFAVLDVQANQLYIVRDPYGIKPVYFTHSEGELSFASEIKPLIAVHGKQKISVAGLSLFLNLRFCPSPETLLEGVNRLAPGHFAKFDLTDSQLSVHRYSQPTTAVFEGGLDEAVEAYHQVMGRAVRRQLLSDVPVGILLSGGIDSALVASYAKDHPGLTGYTVGFGEQYADCEIGDARETADTLGIGHKHLSIDPASLLDELPAIVNAVEEPLGTTSIMAMWTLTQLAKRDVTVVLTGQGSDEPWGGYRRYKIEHLISGAPILASALARPFSKLARFSDKEAVVRGLGCLGISDLAERFRQAYALFTDEQIQEMLPAAPELAKNRIQQWLDWLPQTTHLSSVEKMMRVDTRMNLADDLLLYGDKISMAFALEARVPMLDIELMRFIESLPIHYRSTYKQTKIVHKLTAEKYLPAHIIQRKKKGFQVPFGEWSKTNWKSSVESWLLRDDNPLFDVLNKQGVEKIWKQHLHGGRDLSKQIFALLTLSIWAVSYLT